MSEILRGHNHGFIDLMTRMLQWDPVARITPEDAKGHPWILEVENVHASEAPPRGMLQNELKRKTSAVPGDSRSNRGPLTEAGNMQHAHTFTKDASLQPMGMQSQYNHH